MSDFDPARSVSVEEILAGKRCSPLTLSEFEGFLIHEASQSVHAFNDLSLAYD